jgi:TRAP-type C4-dicarboxylate transport system permease small subunit
MFLISSFLVAIYEIFLAIALVVFAALIVWYAWMWPKQEH